MKRCLCLLLVTLLLTGCGTKPAQEPAQQPSTEPTGLYDAENPMEQQTGGAVRAYPLAEGSAYTKLCMMGSKLLLAAETGEAMVLHGTDCVVVATGTISLEGTGYDVGSQGLAYYLSDSKEVVLLNPQLQETGRLQLPEDIQGEPAISLNSNEIFYCRGGEIRALNMENNVARLIKSHTVADQTLAGSYFDGKVILCVTKDQEGNEQRLYLSGENGLTLSQDAYIYQMETYGNRLFARRLDNWVDQNIFGTMDGELKCLDLPPEEADFMTSALALNGAVSYKVLEDGIRLSFHDLQSWQTTAQVTLPGIAEPVTIAADESALWILSQEEAGQVLYRWEVAKSPVQEPAAAYTTLYTAQAPDTEGLARCKEVAAGMDDTYGVRINLWEDAAETTGDYSVVPEHQVVIIEDMLANLETALQPYPESFLRRTVKSGWIRIGLVRSIDSGEDWVQFWEDGDCYVLISSQADVAKAFLEAVGYAIDSRVIGNSREYDTWSSLNPEGFVYASEAEGQPQDISAYLEGESRAFVNQEAAGSPTEDRRQLFIAAMAEGNDAVFASPAMQAKLLRMCEGIREAYDMENNKEIFAWEQYLHTALVEIGA